MPEQAKDSHCRPRIEMHSESKTGGLHQAALLNRCFGRRSPSGNRNLSAAHQRFLENLRYGSRAFICGGEPRKGSCRGGADRHTKEKSQRHPNGSDYQKCNGHTGHSASTMPPQNTWFCPDLHGNHQPPHCPISLPPVPKTDRSRNSQHPLDGGHLIDTSARKRERRLFKRLTVDRTLNGEGVAGGGTWLQFTPREA